MKTNKKGKRRYKFTGVVQRFGVDYAFVSQPLFTSAVNEKVAANNICFKLKQKFNLEPGAALSLATMPVIDEEV